MPWVRLSVAETRYDAKVLSEVQGTTKFLLDNNIDVEVMLRFLDGLGISANELPLKLLNKPDDMVLAEAWTQDRVLITHDPDFLNETWHPPEVNPGVVVIPGGSGDVERHLPVIGTMLSMMKPYRSLWLQSYVHILEDGLIVIKGVNATTKERIEPWRLRFDEEGTPRQWADE
jgi:hypothetical protein